MTGRIPKKTVLDEFAMAALPALIAESAPPVDGERMALMAYAIAEAMLEVRLTHLEVFSIARQQHVAERCALDKEERDRQIEEDHLRKGSL